MDAVLIPNEPRTVPLLPNNYSLTCALEDIIPQSNFIYIATIVIWCLMVVMGTFSPSSVMGDLSLRRSLKELTAGRRSRLDVLDVFRVMAILWVMINHTGSEGRIDVLERKPSADVFKRNVHEHPIFGALLGNSSLGVEVFLVLSGLLSARSWLRLADLPFRTHYIKFIGRRVLRLAPSILAFLYLAGGPVLRNLLPRFYSSMISSCGMAGIASHITFLGNWQSTPTCLGYMWYLGLDMQLYILAPFLVHILHTRPRAGIFLFISLIFGSSILRAAYCTVYGVCNKSDVDIPFISYPDQDAATLGKIYAGLWEMYARPYTKCGPFLLGLLTGYFTVHFDKMVLSRTAANTLFTVCTTLAVCTIYAILPEYWYPDQGNTVYNTVYTAVFRSVFAVAIIGMMLARIYTAQSVSTSPIWAILGRLTYNAYLLHMPIIYIFNYLPYLQEAEGAIELLVVLPVVSLLSFTAASIFYLFVEAPMGNVSCQWAIKRGF